MRVFSVGLRRVLACLLLIMVHPALAAEPSAVGRSKPLVLLVGLDGFRADYLGRGYSPVLSSLAKSSATAVGLTPVFPTVTFPNHVSLVTGRHPGRHGILNNTMRDPGRPGQVFRLRDRQSVTDPFWWSEAEPIWVTAAKQGRISTTLFWPGSEVLIQGRQPRDWLPYDHKLSSLQRVENLLAWLTKPESGDGPPDFATLYLSEVDSEGHAYGPDSPAVNEAIGRVDEALGRLIRGLREAGLWRRTHLVIAADHGMAFVPAENRIDGRQLIKGFPGARWVWTGPTAGLDLGGEPMPAVLSALARSPQLQCWPKADVPARFGPMTHRRVPDVVCLAKKGWSVSDQLLSFPIPGQHGFDPDHPEMQGLFLAHGPRILPRRLGRVSNLEIYPLLCRLLGISPADHDATGLLVSELLKPSQE